MKQSDAESGESSSDGVSGLKIVGVTSAVGVDEKAVETADDPFKKDEAEKGKTSVSLPCI